MVANEVLELGGGLSLTVSFPPASVDRPKREEKGKSLLDLAESFVVLDFETTGLDPMYDEIIEIGAIRVVAGKAENEYTTLIKPKSPIGSFITDLTGITNDMVKDAPVIESALPGLLEFIGNDVVVGHNTHFDINFLYDCCVKYLKIPFTNNLIDTMRIARNAFKDADGYRLADMADYFKVESKPKHRAINDCRCTLDVYNHMCAYFRENNIDLVALNKLNARGASAKDINTAVTEFDESHPLYGKICVFTGTLDKMLRKDAMQIVVDLGGKCADNVTKKTNYLILGVTDYNKSKSGKSNKHVKAETFQLSGLDIEIISENVFYDIVMYDK